MTSSLNSTTTNKVFNTVVPKTVAKRSPLIALLSLGATGFAGWMIRDSFMGSKPLWDQKYAGIKEHAEFEDTRYGWGHYSGNPGMDHWAHQFKRWTLFGPVGLNMTLASLRTYVGGFLNDVIMPNVVPIAIGIAGIYHTFGKNAIHRPIKKMINVLRPYVSIKPTWNWVDKGAEAIGRGILACGRFAARNPIFSLITIALGAFTLKRFDDSYGHDGQHDLFRAFTNEKSH